MAKKNFSMGSMTELFNQVSSAERADNNFKVEMIDIDDIVTNEINKYEINDIDKLAFSISHVGIKQNLDVYPLGNGKYKLLSGERRYTAVKKLIDEESRDDLRKVPCTITTPDEAINLPISTDIKELWLLTTTNADQRNKTDSDILQDVRNQKKIYQALLDAGVEIKGRQRDIIAAALELSPSQVQRYEFVDKNLNPELKKGFEENKIPLTVAVAAAKQENNDQKKLAKKLEQKGTVTTKDVVDIEEKANKKNSVQVKQPEIPKEPIRKPSDIFTKEHKPCVLQMEDGTIEEARHRYRKTVSGYGRYMTTPDFYDIAIEKMNKIAELFNDLDCYVRTHSIIIPPAQAQSDK